MNAPVSIAHEVRTALPSDEEEVMDMCRALHSENALFEMNEDKVRAVLRIAFERRGGVLGVIGAPGAIEAMIYMLISQLWYSEQTHLEELFSYCRPEYRRSNNAKKLIQFSKKCAEAAGLPLVIGVLSNDRTEQKVKLYQRQFQKPAGSFFVYNSKWNTAAATGTATAA